jgi:hypothetical protein
VAQLLIPDRPVAFGYKQVWLAVRDAEPQVVADIVGVIDRRASTWKEGIDRAYEQGFDRERQEWRKWQDIFVSPRVLGWTLAVGGIGALPAPSMPEWLPWVCDLSRKLGHVQSFGTHRVSSAVFWAKAERGHVLRAYAYADGSTSVNVGDLTPEETSLGFDFLDERRATPAEVAAHQAKLDGEFARFREMQAEAERLRAEAEDRGEEFDWSILDQERFASKYDLLEPGEDSVMMLAGRWSLDPTRLEESGLDPGLGLVGRIPRR